MMYNWRQRGYNLVEMLIALTVLGLVIGGALIPLQQRLQQEEINAVQKQLNEAKAAVRTYAISHRTTGGKLQYYDGVEYVLPAGRPYLPCPDVTGNDGLEDRHPLPASQPVLAATLAIAGSCIEQKGMLPWKTLGLKQTDPWGNHLTYRVDKKFSSQLFGFDESFSADIFDVAKNVLRPGAVFTHNIAYDFYDSRDEAGAVICSDFIDDAGTGGCPNLDLSNVEVGIVSTITTTLSARLVPAYNDVNGSDLQGIIDGAVFVVVSHGRDGHGAINRLGNCRTPPRQTSNLVEIANAYYRSGHPFRGGSFNCSAPVTTVNLRENIFVVSPFSKVVNDVVDAPDDMLVWSGTNELIGFLAHNGVLPLEKLDYLQR